LGFDVKTRQSGTSVYSRGQISKQGNGTMRSMLYMAALNAVRTNLRMKFFYKRLIDRGKPRKVALIAVARKLALIAYAIYKTKEPFKEYVGINRYWVWAFIF